MSVTPIHICHLSLLNPAIHSRIFYKMARSQVEAGYRVSIVGQDSAIAPYIQDGVEIIPLPTFGRMSYRRLASVSTVMKLAVACRADIYQVHTVELLPMAKRLLKKVPGSQVVFDMHEDYVANILHADYYRSWVRRPLARRVQAVLDGFANWGDGLILAERCFEGILKFDPARTVVVQNKFQAPPIAAPKPSSFAHPPFQGRPFMLYTGTIAENWGIFEALDIWKAINQNIPLGFVVAGHGQNGKTIDRVLSTVAAAGLEDLFLLAGGRDYLPFEEVVKFIQACTFGVAFYRLRENIKDRIPTKFFEFMAHQKPILFTANPVWEELNDQSPFGRPVRLPLDPETVEEIKDWFRSGRFVSNDSPVASEVWNWQPEAEKMLGLLAQLIKSRY